MCELNWIQLKETAISWTKEAGEILKESLLTHIKVEYKSNPDDLVTEMDRKVERFFLEKITTHFPDHSFLGEEGINEEVDSLEGTLWIIDPIDGTTNFVHQQYNFAISVAVYHHGIGKIGVIYNVMDNELFHAVQGKGAFINDQRLPELEVVTVNEALLGLNARWLLKKDRSETGILAELVKTVRGVRSYGSAAIEMAYVAANRLDGYISMNLAPWDFAAGKVILEEVGGVITTFKGEPLNMLKKSSVFVGKKSFHEEVLTMLIERS